MSPFFMYTFWFCLRQNTLLLFLDWTIFLQIQKIVNFINGKDVLTVYQLNKIVSILFIFVCIPLTPIIAFEYRDFLVIDKLLESCYKDKNSCNSALIKIHNYQQNAVINKNFSCQTRLLGLEAHFIMAMNSNIKKKEAKSILQGLKKYC